MKNPDEETVTQKPNFQHQLDRREFIQTAGVAALGAAAMMAPEAFEMFGRVQAFQTITGATQYLLTARGVFKETTIVRDASRVFGPDGVTPDKAQQRVIREAMKQFLEPYSRA